MVRDLMQSILMSMGPGITITQVKMQKVDPPAAVIDAFRDVQAARADQERARNEAQAYANRVVPEAQGEAFRIRREAEAYREQAVAEAEGQASRFAAVYNEYKQASDVTRQRIFLETVEKVMQRSNKIIIDQSEAGGGVIPYLPLDRLNSKTNKEISNVSAKTCYCSYHYRRARISGVGNPFTVHQTQQALVLQFGDPRRVIDQPGLNFKMPFVQNIIYIDKRILDLDSPTEELIAADQKRLVVDAFTRYRIKDPLQFFTFFTTAVGRIRGWRRLCPPPCVLLLVRLRLRILSAQDGMN